MDHGASCIQIGRQLDSRNMEDVFWQQFQQMEFSLSMNFCIR